MRIGDDNLFEIGCRASRLPSTYQLYVSPQSFPYSSVYRRRIAERGQLQHGFDESARAPYCTDFVVLRHWRRLSRRADGRRGPGRVHCYLWAVRRAAGMERAWEGARGGSSAEARRVPPGDAAQV
jgi:hypothetical protein